MNKQRELSLWGEENKIKKAGADFAYSALKVLDYPATKNTSQAHTLWRGRMTSVLFAAIELSRFSGAKNKSFTLFFKYVFILYGSLRRHRLHGFAFLTMVHVLFCGTGARHMCSYPSSNVRNFSQTTEVSATLFQITAVFPPRSKMPGSMVAYPSRLPGANRSCCPSSKRLKRMRW